MALDLLAISSSPRRGGNTDLLLDAVLEGAVAEGASIERVRLDELNLRPCNSCGACQTSGDCVLRDDAPGLIERILATPALAFASPIYFMAHSAQAKVLIDRSQFLWARKYLLRREVIAPGATLPRRCLFVACGATRGEKVFAGARVTMKYFLDVLEMEPFEDLLFNRIDEKGAILSREGAIAAAREAGARLVAVGGR